jgi:hypothetical protein
MPYQKWCFLWWKKDQTHPGESTANHAGIPQRLGFLLTLKMHILFVYRLHHWRQGTYLVSSFSSIQLLMSSQKAALLTLSSSEKNCSNWSL